MKTSLNSSSIGFWIVLVSFVEVLGLSASAGTPFVIVGSATGARSAGQQ
jgi:hypothetical protein